jgi:hypothetical protein
MDLDFLGAPEKLHHRDSATKNVEKCRAVVMETGF